VCFFNLITSIIKRNIMKSNIENLHEFAISKKMMITCKGSNFNQESLLLKYKNWIQLKSVGAGSINGHWDNDDMNGGD